MKIIFKTSLLLLVLVHLLQASDLARLRTAVPQITVKKKSDFATAFDWVGFYHLKSALNTLTGETLVVWKRDYPNYVEGKILNSKGVATPQKLGYIPPDGHIGHGVAFNPAKQEFLVVYTRDLSIAGQRFTTRGKPIGSEFEIVSADLQNANAHPRVTFNPHTDGYAMVWDRTEGTAAVLLNQSGKVAGNMIIIKKSLNPNGYYDGWGSQHMHWSRIWSVAFLPSGQKLLVVFQHRSSETTGDYWLATLDPTLNNVSSSNLAKINTKVVSFINDGSWIATRGGWGASLAFLNDGSGIIFYGNEANVLRRNIDLNGRVFGPSSPAFSKPLNNAPLRDPKVAFSTISTGTTGLLIATQPGFRRGNSNPATAWAQVLDSKGRPTGSPVVVDETVTYFHGSELIALPRKASDQFFQFVCLQSLGTESGGRILKIDLDVRP